MRALGVRGGLRPGVPTSAWPAAGLLALVVLLVCAAPARADEQLLTLYSPPIDSKPYVHQSTTVSLTADGVHAPNVPGYVLGFKEQVLVDSLDPAAKPLPVSKMMVHHFLYFTQGPHVVGGYQVDGHVVLYVGTQDLLLSVQVSNGEFASLREAIVSR